MQIFEADLRSGHRAVSSKYTARLHQSGIVPGDRLHIGVAGPCVTIDDAVFTGLFEDKDDPNIICGIRIEIDGRVIPDLWWGDIIELWKLDEHGNRISGDVMAA